MKISNIIPGQQTCSFTKEQERKLALMAIDTCSNVGELRAMAHRLLQACEDQNELILNMETVIGDQEVKIAELELGIK